MKRFLSAMLAMITDASPAEPAGDKWMVGSLDYEGLPLVLRYPTGLDYDSLAPTHPLRVVVTLKLAQVQDNGLPDAAYNRSLEAFDEFVREQLSPKFGAQCVLVETFNGKKIYYAYAAEESAATALRTELAQRYGQHAATIEVEPDPRWSLIRRYAAEFFPAKQ